MAPQLSREECRLVCFPYLTHALASGSLAPRRGGGRLARAFLLSGLTLAWPADALAGEVITLDPVVVRAARPHFSIQPQQVTIVGAEAIASSGASDLGALLSHEGFAVKSYGPAGFLSAITLRGAMAEGVLVLKDGIRLNSPERGGVDLSTVSLLGVERVEVMSGGASGLFGSEAVGGVINLITSDKPASRLATGFGSYGDGYAQLETGGEVDQTTWNAAIKRHTAKNDFPYFYRDESSTRINSQFDGTELNLGAKQRWGYDSLLGSLQVNWQDKGVPGPVNFPSPSALQSDHNALGRLQYQRQWDDALRQDTSLSYRFSELGYHDPAAALLNSDSTLNAADLQSQVVWSADPHELQAGVGYNHEGVNSSSLGTRARDILALFAHDTWYLPGNASAFGDLRLDRHPTFGWNLSPRLGATWQVVPNLRLRSAIGNAYRAPTFNELYWPTDTFSAGNPALQPETTLTGEVGADFLALPVLEANATAFAHRGHHSISWLPGGDGRWSPVNLADTQITGLEARATVRPWDFSSLSGTGTWLSAIDLSSDGAGAGKFLIYRPGLVGNLTATVTPLKGLSAALAWDYTGSRFTTTANTDSLPSFWLLSTRLSYRWDGADEVFVAGDNLLNTYYQTQPYYPMPGRLLRTGWSHTF